LQGKKNKELLLPFPFPKLESLDMLYGSHVCLLMIDYKLRLYTFIQDTFRGRVCECPVVNGVQYKGDGYTTCEGMHFPI